MNIYSLESTITAAPRINAATITYEKLGQLETAMLLSGNRMTIGMLRYEARIRGINESALQDLAERATHEPIMTSAERTIGDTYRALIQRANPPATPSRIIPLDLDARYEERKRIVATRYRAEQQEYLRRHRTLITPQAPQKQSLWTKVKAFFGTNYAY
ncbi:TPA: hypothetical protein HA251_05690 [Candidatus Woesearchaeota archaeon]|nr:hypothetical protein [Candidatus Woesearchaeota archaeon]